jgi:HEAT repeat protein
VVQLFVIPAVVVVVVIVVWLLFGKLAGGERDAMEYVRQIRPPARNMRAAFELASLIQNDSKIGSDPILLGELTDALTYELNRNDDSTLTQYEALALGAFRTLDARTAKGEVVDPLVPLVRALDPKFDAAIRIAAAASLAKQAGRMDGALDDPHVVDALAAAAASDPAEVRQVAVYALGFLGGKKPLEALRRRLAEDDDRFVRYNAAIALARHGDMAAEKTLREMLITADLDKVVDLPSATEKQNKIESIEVEALEALNSSTSNGSPGLAKALTAQITELTKSGLVSVRSQALQVLQNLQTKR